MNRIKSLLPIILLAVLLIITVFIFVNGGKTENKPYMNKQESIPEQVSSNTTSEEIGGFLLIAEENHLNLYEDNKNGGLKKSEYIDFSIFPSKDVEELRQGITFDKVSDAYAMMENYVN